MARRIERSGSKAMKGSPSSSATGTDLPRGEPVPGMDSQDHGLLAPGQDLQLGPLAGVRQQAQLDAAGQDALQHAAGMQVLEPDTRLRVTLLEVLDEPAHVVQAHRVDRGDADRADNPGLVRE